MPELLQRQAEVDVHRRERGVDRDRRAHQVRSAGEVAFRVSQHSEHVQRVEVPGNRGEHLAVEPLGIVELPVSVQCERLLESGVGHVEGTFAASAVTYARSSARV